MGTGSRFASDPRLRRVAALGVLVGDVAVAVAGAVPVVLHRHLRRSADLVLDLSDFLGVGGSGSAAAGVEVVPVSRAGRPASQ